MPKLTIQQGHNVQTLDVTADATLLDQALAQAINIDYSCKRGDCGQCLGELIFGKVKPLDLAKPCMRDGQIYLCNAVADSDIDIRLPYAPELAQIRVIRSPCKIDSLRLLSIDVMEVSLRLPPSANFIYLPGQYLRLTNKNHVTRSYSLAQAPVPNHPLRLHVCRVEQGAFSQYLFDEAKAGDLLHLEGPAGRFFLRDKITVDKTIFLATGTGIAPIYAILSALTLEQRQRCGKLSLYWGNRNAKDAYLLPVLQELAGTLDMQCSFIFSRDPEQKTQTPRYVQELMALHHADLHNAQIFASGNTAMIESARQLAQAAGLSPERFYCDPFTAS